MKAKIINFLMFFTILLLIFIDTQNKYIFVIMNIYIFAYSYLLIKDFLNQKEEEEYKNEKFKIVKKNLLDIDDLIILILKEKKIVWANDNAYLKFPHLKNNRSSNFIFDNLNDDLLKYNNRVYKMIEESGSEDVFVFMEYTELYRMQNRLSNIQTIIGHFQIDNLDSMKKIMGEIEYLEFISSFEKSLYSIFVNNKISFQKVSNNSYYLNFPYDYIKKGIENRFDDLGELITDFHAKGVVVTTTMGIAYNFTDVETTGKKAKEAFELALSRGGGQIVIFENDKKHYFGGGISKVDGEHTIRAKIIDNSLGRILYNKEVVYLVTHKNPDYDGIAAMLLFYEYLKKYDVEVKILIDKEENKKKFELDKLEASNQIIQNYVIDKTKKNILIALDTQSKDIISHPNILEELDEKIIIDHHQTPKNYFRGNIFSWIEPQASSTTELVQNILVSAEVHVEDKLINTIGVLAILTDTNKLKYRTSYQTISSLMHLVESGGNLNDAFEKLYLTEENFKKKLRALSDAKFYKGVTLLDVEYELDNFLLSNIADEMIQIINNRLAVAISKIENKDSYRVKVRTNGNINAKTFIEPFGGGGHLKQGAAIISFEKKEELLKEVKKLYKEE